MSVLPVRHKPANPQSQVTGLLNCVCDTILMLISVYLRSLTGRRDINDGLLNSEI